MRKDGTIAALLLMLGCQLAVWSNTREVQPYFTIVPQVPTVRTVQALSLGDPQFYFRVLGLDIQNAGDGYGHFTALKEYDYAALSRWFSLLDELDNQSNFIPAMASYYYAQTPKAEDTRYIVDYLVKHYAHDPAKKWWWLVQAKYLADHRLNDKPLALKIAYMLADAPGDLPVWARQMPAFVLEDMGEKEEALAIIQGILNSAENLSEGELNFMHYFIEERLNAIDPSLLKPQ